MVAQRLPVSWGGVTRARLLITLPRISVVSRLPRLVAETVAMTTRDFYSGLMEGIIM